MASKANTIKKLRAAGMPDAAIKALYEMYAANGDEVQPGPDPLVDGTFALRIRKAGGKTIELVGSDADFDAMTDDQLADAYYERFDKRIIVDRREHVVLLRASGFPLNYYHPEFVDLKKIRKYKVEGCRFLFVAAAAVKDAIGEQKWQTLSSEATFYMFEERFVKEVIRKKTYPDGEKCRCCGHLIHRTRRYGLRCGPGCDRAEPFNKK